MDHRSDLFSFGAILYELLSGRKAFKRDTASDTIAAILKEEPPELVHSGRNIAPALDHIVRHCLEKDRENRFQSSKDIAFALSEASSPTTLSSGAYVVTAPAPKGRGKTIGIVAAALVLAAAAGLFLWKRPRLGGASAASGVRRVAVLPFENLGAADDDYFADGIADAIRGKLASVPGLEVVARGSSTPYKKTTKTPQEIARELNARYLLTATVRWQKAGTTSRVQVSPELVEIKESEAPATKWQQPFDAALTDVFQVQSDIATKVVDSLGVALGDKQEKKLTDAPTKNVAAYDAYLKGEEATTVMARADPPALRKGLGFYEQAVALDPNFAEAWGRISTCRALLFVNSVPDPALAGDPWTRRASPSSSRRTSQRARSRSASTTVPSNATCPALSRSIGKPRRSAPEIPTPCGRSAGPDADGPLAGIDQHTTIRRSASIRRTRSTWETPLSRSYTCGAAARPARRSTAAWRSRRPISRGSRTRSKPTSAPETSRALGPSSRMRFGSWDRRTPFPTSAPVLEWLFDAENFALLRRLTPAAFDGDEANWAIAQAWASWRAGDAPAAREYGEKAVKALEALLRESPKLSFLHLSLGQMLAMAGHKEAAVREAVTATELEPVDRAPFTGMEFVYGVAQTYMLTGDEEKAVATLERVFKSPYYVTPAWLAVDKTWDPLRQNPKFQRLVAAK